VNGRTRVAKRRRSRKRGAGPTILILLVTSGLVGVALWALWQVTLGNAASPERAPEATASPPPREEIRPSDRERLDALLRRTEEQGKGADSTK
jgi:cytoskeletal protein RodZ